MGENAVGGWDGGCNLRCMECGSRVRTGRRTCPKCGSSDVDLASPHDAAAVSAAVSPATDNRG